MAFLKRAKDPFREIQGCFQKRDYKGALGWFKPLLERDSKNTQIRLRYADTLVLAGSKKEAIRQYSKVADELAEAGFMIRAIAINKKIVQLDPKQTDVHEKLAAMNAERSKSESSRSSLPLGTLRAPAAIAKQSLEEEVPEPSLTRGPALSEESEAPLDREPTLSLEESMAMEFGETAQPVSREEPVSSLEAKPPAPVEEDHVVVDLGEVDLEEGVESITPEEDLERAVATGVPTFDVAEETPSFSEEPVSLGEGPVGEEDETGFELKSEAEEMGLTDEESEAEEAVEEFEVEIETEPDMAADGKNPLVGLLGEDIDSLIDSIIDDVGSSVSRPPSPSPRQATRIPLFSDLTAEEFVDVAIMLVRRTVKPGTVIVKEGDPGESMFIVSTGEVAATREDDGRQVRLATLRDGDFFGEMAVLSGEPRTATVSAVKSTELLELSRNDLQQICSRHPEVEAKLRLAYDERRMASR